MIVCNGVVGPCLVVGALGHHVLRFQTSGTSSAFATLAALAGVSSLVLYGVFVFVQTVRHRDCLQTSLNLALGSALASIGLTIPAIALASIWLTTPLTLGLPPKEIVLLALTLVVGTLTLSTGRATLLQGAVHLSVFSTFIFLAFVP